MYCEHCGKELMDEAVVCPNCGCPTKNYNPTNNYNYNEKMASGERTAITIFMVIGCVLSVFLFLIPLFWRIPMTITYSNRIKQGIPIGAGFKVCTLFFVNLVAGILMLCDDSN